MHNLLDFLRKYHHWLLFVILEVISGVMLFRYNTYQESVWLSSANAMAGKVYEVESGITSFFSMTRANEELTLRNFYLERQVAQLRRLYTEATKDTTVEQRNELQFLSQFRLIPAKVVANTINRPDTLITINKGKRDGIAQGMGVYGPDGVVGVIMAAGKRYSVVLPVLNGSTSISCKVKGSDSFGFLEWNGGDPYVAQIKDMPYHSSVKTGDTVVTTGFSSVFPENIPVGTVAGVERSRNGYTLRVEVNLAVDMSDLKWVYVHTETADEEIEELYEQTLR